MKRLSVLLLSLCIVMAAPAQQKKTAGKQKAAVGKSVVQKKQPAKKQSAKKQTTKQQPAKKQQQPQVTVQSLKNQRQLLQKQMQEQQRKLRENERNVKQRLQNLMVINTEIDDKRRRIDTIRHDIGVLDGNIVEIELSQLTARLKGMDYDLNVTDKARSFLADKGYSREYGARPLKRAIQNYVEDKLAEMMIDGDCPAGSTLTVDLNADGTDLFVTV